MSLKSIYQKFFDKILWLNILAMVIVIILIAIAVAIVLNSYTRHGEAIPVPNVTRMAMSDARHILAEKGLLVEVTDTGYVKELPKDCILEQKPAAGTKVKKGHVVALIVNASVTPAIALPDIIQNCSLREAVARLKSMGFKVGEPQFVRGEKEWVYGITVDGIPHKAGDRVAVNKIVVVQAGNGYMAEEDSVVYVEYNPAAEIDEEPNAGSVPDDYGDRDDFMEIPQ